MRHKLFFLQRSFSLGRSLPSGLRTFVRSGFFPLDEEEDPGVEDREEDLG